MGTDLAKIKPQKKWWRNWPYLVFALSGLTIATLIFAHIINLHSTNSSDEEPEEVPIPTTLPIPLYSEAELSVEIVPGAPFRKDRAGKFTLEAGETGQIQIKVTNSGGPAKDVQVKIEDSSVKRLTYEQPDLIQELGSGISETIRIPITVEEKAGREEIVLTIQLFHAEKSNAVNKHFSFEVAPSPPNLSIGTSIDGRWLKARDRITFKSGDEETMLIMVENSGGPTDNVQVRLDAQRIALRFDSVGKKISKIPAESMETITFSITAGESKRRKSGTLAIQLLDKESKTLTTKHFPVEILPVPPEISIVRMSSAGSLLEYQRKNSVKSGEEVTIQITVKNSGGPTDDIHWVKLEFLPTSMLKYNPPEKQVSKLDADDYKTVMFSITPKEIKKQKEGTLIIQLFNKGWGLLDTKRVFFQVLPIPPDLSVEVIAKEHFRIGNKGKVLLDRGVKATIQMIVKNSGGPIDNVQVKLATSSEVEGLQYDPPALIQHLDADAETPSIDIPVLAEKGGGLKTVDLKIQLLDKNGNFLHQEDFPFVILADRVDR